MSRAFNIHLHHPCNAATYSRLGDRGYNPQAHHHQQQQQAPFQGRRQFERVDDPTYSRLEDFQRPGDPGMINRGAPPNLNQQLMQQGGGGAGGGIGGAGGMGMGHQRMGMGPPPGAANNMLPQQYNPHAQQYGGQMAQNMQYQQQPQHQQQAMNPQSYLGVPQQLVMAQPQPPAAAAVQQQQPQPPPPAQPPAPAKPKEAPGWICPQCTLVNNPRRPGCELCSAARPEDYVVPDEAPLADFEKKAEENEALFAQVDFCL